MFAKRGLRRRTRLYLYLFGVRIFSSVPYLAGFRLVYFNYVVCSLSLEERTRRKTAVLFGGLTVKGFFYLRGVLRTQLVVRSFFLLFM